MQELDISLVIIRQGDEFLLQNRDHNPQGAADMIGAYGGKIDKTDASPLDGACREVEEETSLRPKREDLGFLGKISVICDYKGSPAQINGWSYIMDIATDQEVESREGTLVRMTKEQAEASLRTFTPGTRACFEQYIINQEANL